MAKIRTVTKTIRRRPLRVKVRPGVTKVIPLPPIRIKTTIRTK